MELTREQEAIVAALQGRARFGLSSEALARATGLSEAGTAEELTELRKRGVVKLTVVGASLRYRLAPEKKTGEG